MSSRLRCVLGACGSLAVILAAPAEAQSPAKKPAVPRPASPTPAPPAPPAEAVIETADGQIVIKLLAEVAPGHVAHFAKTAKAGGYDGTTFHRIIARGIIQGGDLLSKDPAKAPQYGTGGLGLLKAEFGDRPFVRGAVGAARRPSNRDSGGSQFFICLTDLPTLNGQYTLFGEVVSGIEVADRIGDVAVDGDKPRARIEIRKVSVRSSP